MEDNEEGEEEENEEGGKEEHEKELDGPECAFSNLDGRGVEEGEMSYSLLIESLGLDDMVNR